MSVSKDILLGSLTEQVIGDLNRKSVNRPTPAPSSGSTEETVLRARLAQAQGQAKKAAEEANAALAMKDELLKEWMHSNEAFKRLARKYGKKLGVSDEQRQNDLDDQIIEVAEEKPEFAKTDTLKAAKEARGLK